MHMKGRKHRLQFKKKVDPKLKVEMKPNNFKNKRNEKWKKQTEKPKEIRKKDFRLVLSSVSVFLFHMMTTLMTSLTKFGSTWSTLFCNEN